MLTGYRTETGVYGTEGKGNLVSGVSRALSPFAKETCTYT